MKPVYKMDFKIPDKLTFKRSEVIKITQLDGRVIDYWEKEFGGFSASLNQAGERFYSRKDVELIFKIKQWLIVEKRDKSAVKKSICGNQNPEVSATDKPAINKDKGKKLANIKSQLKEILTILDKNGKK
jgi:DNA-binding transcriptional MerR regulator